MCEKEEQKRPLRGQELIRYRELEELRRMQQEEEAEYKRGKMSEEKYQMQQMKQRMKQVNVRSEMVLIDSAGDVKRVFDNLAQACIYFNMQQAQMLNHVAMHKQIHGRMLVQRSEHIDAWASGNPITFTGEEDPTEYYKERERKYLDLYCESLSRKHEKRKRKKEQEDGKPSEGKAPRSGYHSRKTNNFKREDFPDFDPKAKCERNSTNTEQKNEEPSENRTEKKERVYREKGVRFGGRKCRRVKRLDTGTEYPSISEFARSIGLAPSTVNTKIHFGVFEVNGVPFRLVD